jgi:predicted RNA-binding protein YlxR (DUF448 family)
MKRRKVPMRKCVASQEMKPKRDLYRIVRSKEGDVTIDPTGKKSGRGAYLSKEKECILLAKQRKVLDNHLEVKVDPALYDELIELLEKEK